MDDGARRELKEGYVNLKDHFDMLLSERQAQMELRFMAAAHALELSKIELDRRLDVLNHAHEQAKQKDSEYVKDSEYKIKTAYYDEWCRGVDKKFAYYTGGMAVLILVLQLIFHFLHGGTK